MRSWRALRSGRFGLLVLLVALLPLLSVSPACPRTLVPGVAPVGASDPVRGAWMSTDLQVLNLAMDEQPITARFYGADGSEVYSFTAVLPGGGTRVYAPADLPGFPAGFSGTVVLETPVRAAMGVTHLEKALGEAGSAIFPGVPDQGLGPAAFFPFDRCVFVWIHNLDQEQAMLTLYAFDPGGVGAGALLRTVPANGYIVLRPVGDLGLPWPFVGQAMIAADRPLEVTVRNDCQGWSAFAAPLQGSTELLLPHVPISLPPLITTTVALQNTAPVASTSVITWSNGMTMASYLEPYGGVVLTPPLAARGSAVIRADQPLVAVVHSVGGVVGEEEGYDYRAFDHAAATPAVALPILFHGFDGWETGDRIWVRNEGPVTATVIARYVSASTGTPAWDRAVVGPGEIRRLTLPDLPDERAAAILLADQPIVALAGAANNNIGIRDRFVSYRGTNVILPACTGVAGLDFSWQPAFPPVSQTVAFVAQVAGPAWYTATVDGEGDVGRYSSLALDAAGRPHISYADTSSGALKYAWHDGVAWRSVVVDDRGPIAANTSLALDALGRPHISYRLSGDLYYAYYDGAAWHRELAYAGADVGDNSLELDAAGRPHISFLDNTNLLYASYDGLAWNVEVVESVGNRGHYNSLELDASGLPRIAYCDVNASAVKYAHFDGTYWISETVAGDAGVQCYASLALDAAGRPHIAYYDAGNRDLRYAWFDGVTWHIQTVDGPARVGTYNAIALDGTGRPHFSYYDWSSGNLKYAYFDGSSWVSETVDGAGEQYTSLALDSDGHPHIAYYGATGADLRYAEWTLPTPPITYAWDMGDGAVGSGATVVHTYGFSGTYTVTLTATNCLGFSSATVQYALTVQQSRGWTIYLPLVFRSQGGM